MVWDVWLLNHHKLLLGMQSDATIATVYKTALQGSVIAGTPFRECSRDMLG